MSTFILKKKHSVRFCFLCTNYNETRINFGNTFATIEVLIAFKFMCTSCLLAIVHT